jgi:hypothetical protein
MALSALPSILPNLIPSAPSSCQIAIWAWSAGQLRRRSFRTQWRLFFRHCQWQLPGFQLRSFFACLRANGLFVRLTSVFLRLGTTDSEGRRTSLALASRRRRLSKLGLLRTSSELAEKPVQKQIDGARDEIEPAAGRYQRRNGPTDPE